jgi:hypothetical protein
VVGATDRDHAPPMYRCRDLAAGFHGVWATIDDDDLNGYGLEARVTGALQVRRIERLPRQPWLTSVAGLELRRRRCSGGCRAGERRG